MKNGMCEFCIVQQSNLSRHLDGGSCRTKYLILSKDEKFLETLNKYQLFEKEKQNYEEQIRMLNKKIYELEIKCEKSTNEKREFEKNIASLLGHNLGQEIVCQTKFNMDIFKRKVDSKKLPLFRSIWEEYKKFVMSNEIKNLDDEDALLNVDLANKFIKSIKTSSAAKIKQTLQFLLKYFMNFSSLKLEKINNAEIESKPKFSFEPQKLHQFLEYQSKVNYDDYVLQCILACFGLRINTASLLKIRDFKDLENNKIILPDKKTKINFVCKVSDRFKKFIRNYLPSGEIDPESYIFCPKNKDLRKRLVTNKKRINRRIKKAFEDLKIPTDGMTCSSHIFRKTTCFNFFRDGVTNLIKEAGSYIGHIPGSNATRNYIYSNHERWLPETPIPLILRDGTKLEIESEQKEKEKNEKKFNYILRKKRKRQNLNLQDVQESNDITEKRKVKIRKRKSKNEVLIDFYKENFINWTPLMTQMVNNYFNIIYFSKSKILAAITFKKICHKNLEFFDILLLAVDKKEREKGLGPLMVETLKKMNSKLVVWADNYIVDFYTKKLNFQNAPEKWPLFRDLVEYFDNSEFCISGFSEDDLNIFNS